MIDWAITIEVAKMMLGVAVGVPLTLFAMVVSAYVIAGVCWLLGYLVAGVCWLGLMLVALPSWLMGEFRQWASKRAKQ